MLISHFHFPAFPARTRLQMEEIIGEMWTEQVEGEWLATSLSCPWVDLIRLSDVRH